MLNNLKCRGIFSKNKRKLIEENAFDIIKKTNIENVVIICNKKNKEIPFISLQQKVFSYEDMGDKGTGTSSLLGQINNKTLIIFDDVLTARNYPTTITRNIVNFVCPYTKYKIIADDKLIVKNVVDLFAPFYFLSKKILFENHYWCYLEDHNEVSVFNDKIIVFNKDYNYLAEKIKPFIIFDLPAENDFYKAVAKAEIKTRLTNIDDLFFERNEK